MEGELKRRENEKSNKESEEGGRAENEERF